MWTQQTYLGKCLPSARVCKPSNRMHLFACRVTQIACTGVLLCGHCHLSARTANSLKDVTFLYYPTQTFSVSVLPEVKLFYSLKKIVLLNYFVHSKGVNKPGKAIPGRSLYIWVDKAVIEGKELLKQSWPKRRLLSFLAGICLWTALKNEGL